MRQVGANLGDTITVTGEGHSVDLKVVGRAVFPDFGFGPGLGEGAGITFSQLQVLFPGVDEDLYLTDVVPGTNFAEVQARVNPTLIGFGAGGLALGPTGATAGASLDNAKRVRSLPSLLAGVLGLMAVAMLAHTQLSSIRRRRRDLAILKTLGFTKRQVSATVAWQASTLVTVSLVIGVPLGMAIGRWAWTLFAENLGVTSEPVVPFGQILLLIPAAIIFANLIALLPGLSAGRTKPSIVLRSE
jgi:predicted lysophospholipase L1 biosynthesis ABC-type transport system permease subunit